MAPSSPNPSPGVIAIDMLLRWGYSKPIEQGHHSPVCQHYQWSLPVHRRLVAVSSHLRTPPSHSWPRYYTPLHMENLRPFLAGHPDQAFAAYMHDGLTMGFRIGYAGHGASCGRNHPSSLANEEVVLKRIAAEVTAGRLHGPLPAHLLPQVHVSPN